MVLGEGRDKSRIQEQIEGKGLTKKFHFLGSYLPEEMPYHFSCADGLLITLKKADIFCLENQSLIWLAANQFIGALDGIICSSYFSLIQDLHAENINFWQKIFLNYIFSQRSKKVIKLLTHCLF